MTWNSCQYPDNESVGALSTYKIYEKLLSYLREEPEATIELTKVGWVKIDGERRAL